jgi:hypothetical protein
VAQRATARLGQACIVVLAGIYFCVAMLMLPYYNWQYAREHGFAAWMFLGQFVPTVKAAVWPRER